MRTQSPDTSLAAEQYLIERIHQAPASKRFYLIQALSQRLLSDPTSENARQDAIYAITYHYGRHIGQRVQQAFTQYPDWHEQPVDLSAILWPVVHTLATAGISSYITGSIASSLHGMQQSASDIDLVLVTHHDYEPSLASLLAPLSETYLVEPEEIQRAHTLGQPISIIHIATLMKLDLIVPQTPDFDMAMQQNCVSLSLDERYEPFLVASALEMAVWKLVRCTRQWKACPDRMVNDAEWNDLLGVLKVQGSDLDVDQLAFWVRQFDADDLLSQALDDAGLLPRNGVLWQQAG
jgi:hypothetical protein